MFETGVRQLRLAMSMVRGRPIDARNVERLIGDALATLAAFGSPGDDLQEMLDGPFSDPRCAGAFRSRPCAGLRVASPGGRRTTASCSARSTST